MDSNVLGWSRAMAPGIMGNPERPELAEELRDSLCRADPDIAKRFARVTFLSDNRADLDGLRTPTLLMQCADDVTAPDAVGAFVHGHLPGGELVRLQATGHCPHVSHPAEVIDVRGAYLGRAGAAATHAAA